MQFKKGYLFRAEILQKRKQEDILKTGRSLCDNEGLHNYYFRFNIFHIIQVFQTYKKLSKNSTQHSKSFQLEFL